MRTGLIFDVSGMMTSIRWFTSTGCGTRCWRSISTVSASTEPGRCGDSLLQDTLTVWRWAQTAAWWPQSSPQLLLYQVQSWFCDIEMMKKMWIDKSTYLKIFQLELKLKFYLSLKLFDWHVMLQVVRCLLWPTQTTQWTEWLCTAMGGSCSQPVLTKSFLLQNSSVTASTPVRSCTGWSTNLTMQFLVKGERSVVEKKHW